MRTARLADDLYTHRTMRRGSSGKTARSFGVDDVRDAVVLCVWRARCGRLAGTTKALRQNDTEFCEVARLCALLALEFKVLRQNDTGFCEVARLCALLAVKYKALRQNDTEFCEVARLCALLAVNHKALRQNDTEFCEVARLCALLALKYKALHQNDTGLQGIPSPLHETTRGYEVFQARHTKRRVQGSVLPIRGSY